MALTKKHFEALAAALKDRMPVEPRTSNVGTQWYWDVQAMTDVCARFNPNFDRVRFLKACGVES